MLRCMNKSSGFVLLVVLVMLQILILLGWCMLENNLLAVKAIKNNDQRYWDERLAKPPSDWQYEADLNIRN